MSKPFKHFRTITKHRHKVISHCFKAGIGFQGLFHDLSKYSPAEFISGARYYQGTRSPNEEERVKFGYSKAWMHHKGRNRHHFEYWTDYNPQTKIVEPVKMPLNYVVEMFCYKNTDPLNYFLKAKARRVINKETSDTLESLLEMLAEKGEAETFAYIKEMVKEYKKHRKS